MCQPPIDGTGGEGAGGGGSSLTDTVTLTGDGAGATVGREDARRVVGATMTAVVAALAFDGLSESDGDGDAEGDVGMRVDVVSISVGVAMKWVETPGCVAVRWLACDDARLAASAVPPPSTHKHPAMPM